MGPRPPGSQSEALPACGSLSFVTHTAPSLGLSPAGCFPTPAYRAGTPSTSLLPDLPFWPRGSFEALGKLAMSVDIALRGLSVSLRSEGADVATQAVSPTCRPPQRLILTQGSDGMGHTQPLPSTELESPPCYSCGPTSCPQAGRCCWQGLGGPQCTRGAACRGPPQSRRSGCGRGGLSHPAVSHPADTPACSTQVCVFFFRGGEGG